MRITLSVTEGPHQGLMFTFEEHDTFIVGRSSRAHFRLPDKDQYFSRFHFLVEVNPPRCRLMDMDSKNGTYVNGQKVTVADLKDGDRIEGGQTTLCVAVQRDPVTPDALPSTTSDLIRPTPPVAAAPEPEAAPRYDTLKPSGIAAPFLASLRQPAPAAVACRVCAGPVTQASQATAKDLLSPDVAPLCPTCQEEIRKQPQPVADYLIVRELGQGGMGIVYLALRKAEGTLVAVKMIQPNADATEVDLQRFLREANILRDLSHPHIVAFRDMGQANGQLYFAMDYVRGTDAARLLRKEGPLPVARAVGLVCQLLEALAYAHAKSYVHRDIKPANLLVTEQDGREVIKLADFGLARVYQASQLSGLTMTGDVGGTTAFMAPEQITNFRKVKPPVDQYSAAATLYSLLTNRTIYDLPHKAEQQIVMVLQEEPVAIQSRRADLPKRLAQIIHRALARKPENRFADVEAMRKALVEFGP